MAKIICVTTGLRGIFNASLGLTRRLNAAQHDVLLTAPGIAPQRLQAEGLPVHALPPLTLNTTSVLPNGNSWLGRLRRWLAVRFRAKVYQDKALTASYPAAFLALIEQEQPDLLILDIELHEYIICAHARHYPVVLLSQWFSTWRSEGLPYICGDTILGAGPDGSPEAIDKNWQNIKEKRTQKAQRKAQTAGATDRRSTLLRLAKNEGFPLSLIEDNYWPGPLTYDQLPVISLTAEAWEFPHQQRPYLFYLGPMVAENRHEAPAKTANNYELTSVLASARTNQQRLIYCSVSTLQQGDLQFLRQVMAAVAIREDWLLVISMGGNQREFTSAELPKNCFCFSFVPQLQVLQQADCSINHGGIHTMNECIAFGVPMLVYSGKHADQNGCAARAVYHGLGLRGDKDTDSSEHIRNKLQQLLDTPAYKAKTLSIQQQIKQAEKAQVLEKKIQSFLNQPHG